MARPSSSSGAEPGRRNSGSSVRPDLQRGSSPGTTTFSVRCFYAVCARITEDSPRTACVRLRSGDEDAPGVLVGEEVGGRRDACENACEPMGNVFLGEYRGADGVSSSCCRSLAPASRWSAGVVVPCSPSPTRAGSPTTASTTSSTYLTRLTDRAARTPDVQLSVFNPHPSPALHQPARGEGEGGPTMPVRVGIHPHHAGLLSRATGRYEPAGSCGSSGRRAGPYPINGSVGRYGPTVQQWSRAARPTSPRTCTPR